MTDQILKVEGLGFGYKPDQPIFENVSFSLKKGNILTILGANGCGKSTMLNCLSGILHVQHGTIEFMGKDIRELDIRTIAKHLSYVQQVHVPTHGFRVDEYLLMGRSPYISLSRAPREEDYQAVDRVIEELGIEQLSDKHFEEISGGERQQVQIARALVQDPDLIFLDEPTNHLDFGNQFKVLQLLKRLSEEGYTIVLTTHVPDHAVLLDGLVGIMGSDHHLALGTADTLINQDNLQAIYDVGIDVFYSNRLGRKICAYKRFGEGGSDGC